MPQCAPQIAAAMQPMVSVSPPILAAISAAFFGFCAQKASASAAVTDSLVIVPVPITS